MEKWKKTSCVLCAQNCGLETLIENNRIVKVRPDKSNLRSEGYFCRKGRNLAFHEHHAQRLDYPLKRVGDKFERVSWETAATEIGAKLRAIVDEHGPRSFAYMGGGGQGCHFEAAFGRSLMAGLGSQYHYNAMAQELTGFFWSWGQALGRQYMAGFADHHRCDVFLAIGWNGMMSHQMPQAPRFLKEFAADPEKTLVVIDPRKSETASIADIHLAIRPGTDALLTRAMISIILAEGWHDKEYIEKHVTGFDKIRPLFEGFDARAAIEVCELDFEEVKNVCRLVATKKSCMHPDLGVFMNRHSTAVTALEIILLAVCGRIGVPGGQVIPGTVMPLGSHSDASDPKLWRTVETGFRPIMGYYPPNVMPEEIMSDKPERLRAVLCSGSNPLRSYADTAAYEEAFDKLDLLVTIELAMTETAAMSDYVLPARSGYESWDGTFFPWNFPEVFFQLRRPVLEPMGERLETGEIITMIAKKAGLVPELPDELYKAAGEGRPQFGMALLKFVKENPKALGAMPFVVSMTLGQALCSGNLAALWGLLQTAPAAFRANAERAGFEPGPLMGERIFQALLDHPEGIWVGKCDPSENLELVRTADGKINIEFGEVADWIGGIDAVSEQKALADEMDMPLLLMAGRHMNMNANTLMRDPAWNEGRRACTLAMSPADAEALGMEDGQTVRVSTSAGSVEIELEVTGDARPGMVIMPHGFGLVYEGSVYGANVNRLTKNTHRDKLAGTPLHRFVPCRVETI